MGKSMTDNEMAEFMVLKMANEYGKFALEVGASLPSLDTQEALQRLQVRGWVRFLDISPIAEHPNRLFRIFMASAEAMTWYKSRG
jgi:hypothetical protein